MSKHILVFDSGLGGTTVLDEIHKRQPDLKYSYALDNQAFPYGNKSNHYLSGRIEKLFTHLMTMAMPDLVVIACNTASTLILDTLRNQYDIPFVGVVPAIKPAANISTTRHIGLLATEATIRREYIDQLQQAHAEHCQLHRFATPELVKLAEQKMTGEAVDTVLLEQVVARIKSTSDEQMIDTFILGCTHFPALKQELASYWQPATNWIDSGDAIARRVEALLSQIPAQSNRVATPTLYLSAPDNTERLINPLADYGIRQFQHIVMH